MIEFKTSGKFGKIHYQNIPTAIIEALLPAVTKTAYKAAVRNAPWDPEPDNVHIKEDLKWYFSPLLQLGVVWIKSPYAAIANYGSRHRLAHPFMQPASKAGQQKMKRELRKIIKEAIRDSTVKA